MAKKMIRKTLSLLRPTEWQLKKQYKKLRIKLKLYSILEIHIVDHCNLKCAGCSHFSPIADPWFVTLEDYEKQIRTAAKFFAKKIKKFHILGGEPLLHPDIEKIMSITRKYFCDNEISVVTNGLLVKTLDESFWKAARDNEIAIAITQYPCVEKFDAIVDYVKSKNAKIITYGVRNGFTYRGMNEKGIHDWKKNYKRCPQAAFCLQIRDGKLYTCAMAAYIDIINKKFGTNFEIDKNSYLVLEDIKSANEIYGFRWRAKKECRYCDLDSRITYPWRISKCERSEWIIDE